MKICYFGIYNPLQGRNKVYIKGLIELGHTIVECSDNSRGLLKYFRLWQKHREIEGQYDALVVGYPGHGVVWLAKLISNKKVVFDAGWTMEEGVIISRKQYGFLWLKYLYIKLVDSLAVKCADVVLVESEEQRKYFIEKFGKKNNQSGKYKVIYTGTDDGVFYADPAIKKREAFTVVFRGKFLPEAGVKHVVEAAKLLENQGVNFLIIGSGFLEKDIRRKAQNSSLQNLTLITINLSPNELREQMQSCHVSLGQLESHERLKRTIPHKCFESIAMSLPYVTARTVPVAEILKDGESCLMVEPAEPKDLAEKILFLKNNPEMAQKIGENGHRVFEERLTPKALAGQIVNLLK